MFEFLKKKEALNEPIIESQPYDDAFRTLVTNYPRLVIPLINYVFKTDYSEDEHIDHKNNELFFTAKEGYQKKTITDACLTICNSTYHFECQSTIDGTIQIRIVEYDVQIALNGHEFNAKTGTVVMKLPNSSVLYLRSDKNVPDEMTFVYKSPDHCICDTGDLIYRTPVIKLNSISIDTIEKYHLFLLAPFMLFNYEADLKYCESDPERMAALMGEMRRLTSMLDMFYQNGFLNRCEIGVILEMSEKIMRNLTKNYKHVHEELNDLIGSKLSLYPTEEAYNKGFSEGAEEGFVKGTQKRAEETAISLIQLGKLSPDEIAECSGLTKRQIKSLVKKQQGKCLDN